MPITNRSGRPESRKSFHRPPFILFALLIIFVISYVIYHMGDERPPPPPGVVVADGPGQQTVEDIESRQFTLKGATITPRKMVTIRARVLGVAHYTSRTELARLSPADFLLGWGFMSDSANIGALRPELSKRIWYTSSKSGQSRGNLLGSVMFSHIIPANEQVASSVMKVRKYDIIKMNGYIVDMHTLDGYIFKSPNGDDVPLDHWNYFWVNSIVIEP